MILYVPQAVERVLAAAFGNKLCWFESHYRHVFYVPQAVERVLEYAFETNCFGVIPSMGFILCSPGS